MNVIKLQNSGYKIIENDGSEIFVPEVQSNRHYQKIQKWINEGNTPTPEFSDEELLQQVKQKKKAEIKSAYLKATNAFITIDGVDWDNGFDSAIKLDGEIRFCEQLGLDKVVFFDYHNNPHNLSLSDAKNIVTQIATEFRTLLTKKQSLYKQLTDTPTIAEVESIKW